MRDIREEFLKFIKSSGVVGVAIGIVMGQAVAKVITTIVEGLVMPILEVLLPGNKWQEAVWHLGRVSIKIGPIIATLIDFFIISAVVFFLFRYILRINLAKEEEEGE